jgi:hypothetical protein
MGWGVDYSSSYPAALDWILPSDWRAINLGVDGFGTIAATEKSISLWDRFPADVSVYLFTPNDFEDDAKAVALRKRPRAFHLALGVYDWLREKTFTANLPFALKWYFHFRSLRADRATAREKRGESSSYPRELEVLHVELDKVEVPDHHLRPWRRYGIAPDSCRNEVVNCGCSNCRMPRSASSSAGTACSRGSRPR